jgi:DNA repair protein RecN (Recombination protein N)
MPHMLAHLSIQNYALIEHLDLDLRPGLTALTGETGSGKSIILGALGLVLGERAESGILRNPELKCFVEAIFHLSDAHIPFFEKHDLDYEPHSYLRREITPNGKSRAFINDTPVNLSVLKELGEALIDIHSQQEQQLLTDRSFRFAVLDAYAGNQVLLVKYQAVFNSWKSKQLELKELTEKEASSKLDEDYFQFQFQELESARLDETDQTTLEGQLKALEHADQIQAKLAETEHALDNLEQSIPSLIKQLAQKLKAQTEWHSMSGILANRLDSTAIELQDILNECESAREEIVGDPERQESIALQLDELYRLQQKHRVQTVGELKELKEELSSKLEGLSSMEDQIHTLESEIKLLEKELNSIGDELSDKRSKSSKKLEGELSLKLQKMSLPHASIRFEVIPSAELHLEGKDKIRLLFKANKGGEEKDIAKVASGGERSRVMLALKATLASKYLIPTLILDEIDAGVSGEVALKMAEIMKEMSGSVQLITVTHLPQVAAAANTHLKVFKTTDKHSTFTHLSTLKDGERISELAEMLSGKSLTEAAKANAEALLKPWNKK